MPIDFWVVHTLQIQPSTALFELTVYVNGIPSRLAKPGGTEVRN